MGKDYEFKVIIAGGGVVGLTLANALEVHVLQHLNYTNN